MSELEKVGIRLSKRKRTNAINKGFVPTHLIREGTNELVQWVNLSKETPLEPFFERTVIKAVALRNAPIFYSELRSLTESNHKELSLPNGLVFHMSRCGSTLLTNMFNKIEKTWAFGEPELLDEIFSAHNGDNDAEVIALLQTALKIYGHHNATKKYSVIKFPSYATLALPLITKAFPVVPRIFLYRDPVEVLASNLKNLDQSWMYMTELVGMTHECIAEENTPLTNCALALRSTCEFFIDHFDQNSIVINYAQLCNPESASIAWKDILKKFNIEISEDDLTKSLAELNVYSKKQNEVFSPDSSVKKESASAAVYAAAEKYLIPVYQKLESLNVIG